MQSGFAPWVQSEAVGLGLRNWVEAAVGSFWLFLYPRLSHRLQGSALVPADTTSLPGGCSGYWLLRLVLSPAARGIMRWK